MISRILLALSCLVASFLNAQIPNRNMEKWENGPVLHGWKTNSRPLTLPPWEPYIVRQDSQAFEGKFAAGFYANGLFRAEATCAFPVRYHPKQLELWYKLSFAPCVNDQGFPQQDTVRIRVDLLNNGQVVDQGFWESSVSASQYTRLSIHLSEEATTFDSCRITIQGGLVYGGCGVVPEATYLLVDALALRYSDQETCIDPEIACPECGCPEYYEPVCGCDGMTYGNDCEALRAGVTSWDMGKCPDSTIVSISKSAVYQAQHASNSWAVYPNPVRQYEPIYIKSSGHVRLSLFDLKGALIWSGDYQTGGNQPLILPSVVMNPGVYLLKLEQKSDSEIHFIRLLVIP